MIPTTSSPSVTRIEPTFTSTIRLIASKTVAEASILRTSTPLPRRISETRPMGKPYGKALAEGGRCLLVAEAESSVAPVPAIRQRTRGGKDVCEHQTLRRQQHVRRRARGAVRRGQGGGRARAGIQRLLPRSGGRRRRLDHHLRRPARGGGVEPSRRGLDQGQHARTGGFAA